MSFTKDIILQVNRYKQAIGEELTLEQIQEQPWPETVHMYGWGMDIDRGIE